MTEAIHSEIKEKVSQNKVMLFMKGTPQFPQCGFSSTVVQILDYLQVDFETSNVLEDDALRNGIKTYADWPTSPQLYVNGEFVGGCDIIREMYETGELAEMFQTHGIDAKPS